MNRITKFNFIWIGVAVVGLARAVAADEGAIKTELVRVKPIVELDTAKEGITLADLVVAPKISQTAREILKQVRLGDAPRPGETRDFTDVGLNDLFQTQVANIKAKTGEYLRVDLPARITVSKRRFRLRSEDVENQLLKIFRAICSDCDFEVSNLSIPLLGASFGDNPQWNIRTRAEIPRGGFSYPLEVTSDKGVKNTYWVSGQLTVRRKVPVVSREIEAGEHLQAQDYTWSMKDVTFASDLPASQNEIDSGVVGRSIGAGQILWRSFVRRELAVRGGDGVRVFAGNNDWQITMEGVAESSGYVGDMIKVKIPHTQKIVSGLLKEKGLVEVQ